MVTCSGDGKGGRANAIVLVPICSAEEPREMTVPSIVIPWSFRFTIDPAAMASFEEMVNVCLPKVKNVAGVGDGLGRNAGSVDVPSTRSPFECKATVAPESSVELSPRLMEFPSTMMTRSEDAAWIACTAIVVVGGGVVELNHLV